MDDPRILPLVASVGAAFAFLFSSWSNKQDNDEFFDGYQDTERKVRGSESRPCDGRSCVSPGHGLGVDCASSGTWA